MKPDPLKNQVIAMVFGLASLHGVLLEPGFVRAEIPTALKTPVLISKAKADGTSENNRAGKIGGNGGTRNADRTNRAGGSSREDGTNRVNGIKKGDGTNAPENTPIRATEGTGGLQNKGVNATPKGDGTSETSKGDGTN